METKIMKVAQETGDSRVAGSIQVNSIVLCDLDAFRKDNKLQNAVVAETLGNLAQCKFYAGDIVAVKLQHSVREFEGRYYNDVVARDIVKLN